MKKFLTLFLAAAILFAMIPFGSVAEAALVSYVPQHLMLDFENGWDASGGTVDNGTAEWTDQNTLMGSKGSLKFSTTANLGTIKFPVSFVSGNTYEISLWLRFDEAPKTNWATFVIHQPRTDGNGSCWNQITATRTGDFAAGKWVKISATYTATGKGSISGSSDPVDCNSDGTIEFRLGSGNPASLTDNGTLSYTMDDFFVIPQVHNTPDATELMPNGSFASDWSNGWSRSGSSWRSEVNATQLSSGANGTTGAVQVDVTRSNGCIYTTNAIPFKFGHQYTLSFWAKAADTATANQGIRPNPYLKYSGNNAFDSMRELGNGYSPTLTTAWQKFTYTFTANPPADATTPPQVTFYFRMGRNLNNIKYAVDEVSLKESGVADFTVSAAKSGAIDQSGLRFGFSQAGGFNDCYVYRILRETPQGTYCIQSGKTTDNTVFVPRNTAMRDNELQIDLLGIDDYGRYSQLYSSRVGKVEAEDAATLRPDQYLWNDDVDTLGATLTYYSKTGTKRVKTIAALYDCYGKLLCVNETTKTINTNNKDTCTVSVATDPLATKAQFFAWFEDSLTPITYQCEITKTTEGEFIYVDAESTEQEENGSFDKPFKTIKKAQERLRTVLKQTAEDDIYVVFKPGEYTNVDDNGKYSTIELTSGDWSTSKNVIYTSLTSDRAKISGARHISGFTLWQNGIYRAQVPAGTNSRQLYVNGIKATRARSVEDVKGFTNLDAGKESDTFLNKGIESTDTSIVGWKRPEEIEFVFIDQWKHQYIMPDAVALVDGKSHFTFEDGKNLAAWQYMCRKDVPVQQPVYIENALELLDEEGEWYLDTHENYVYYKPRYFETSDFRNQTADVVIPVVDRIMSVCGGSTSSDYKNFAQNMRFENLDFEYSTWNYPTTNRSFTYTQNSYHDRPDDFQSKSGTMNAAFELWNVKNVIVDNCDFKYIGSIGMKLFGAARDCQVIGNEFYEISGTALVVGDHAAGYWPVRTALEYNQVSGNLIANNYIHKVATDYYGASAIAAGYPVNTTIRNNEIVDGSYSGIHVGWGWEDTASATVTRDFVIEKNYIHDFLNGRLYDGAGIYTLGKTGGTANDPNIIRENYIKDIKNIPASIYPDETSDYWSITKNVIDQENYPVVYYENYDKNEALTSYNIHWLHLQRSSINDIKMSDNYSTTSAYENYATNSPYVAPHLYPSANWPTEAQKIINNAGIEPRYQDRFDFDIQTINTPTVMMLGVNEEEPIIYSVVSSKDQPCDVSNVMVQAKSSDTTVATVSNGKVTGQSAGTAWITLSFCRQENGKVTYYDEHMFRVQVQ